MFSEQQISVVVTACEKRLGCPLTDLRARLLRQRNWNGTIWELHSLYVPLHRFENVNHEPGAGMPDVFFERFWRVTFVY